MELTKNIAFLVNNYFDQLEYQETFSALLDRGARISVISNEYTDLQAINNFEFGDKFKADLLISQSSPENFDALVLIGGIVNADRLRSDLKVQEWLLSFLDNNQPVAAISYAPWLLVSAKAVNGRRLTSYFTIREDIVNAGGEWLNSPVVIDRNLITARNASDLPYFNYHLINLLNQQNMGSNSYTNSTNDFQFFKPNRQYYLRSRASPSFKRYKLIKKQSLINDIHDSNKSF